MARDSDESRELSERAEPAKATAARNALQGLLGIVKVDRPGKGYADLAIGVPTSLVAGACFAPSRRCPCESG